MIETLNTIAQITLILCGFVVAAFEICSDRFKKGQTRHNVLRFLKICVGFLVAGLGVVTWVCSNHLDQQLRLTLDRECVARRKVEQTIKARELTADQKRIISGMLKDGPRGVVYLRPKSFDAETTRYGEQLGAILAQAGFDVRYWQEATLSWSLVGTFLLVTDLKKIPDHASVIQRALMGAGISLPAYENRDVPEGAIMIGVGERF